MTRNVPGISLLQTYEPSETAIFEWLKPRIDDSTLYEIAAADYGCETEENLAALKSIRDLQEIPIPLRYIPLEVLELIRWSEPEDPSWKPGSTGTRGHLMRAFCCAVLLKAADDLETRARMFSEHENLIQLVSSALYLGREAAESTLSFLSWRLTRQSIDESELPFFLLALMFLRVALFEPHQDETGLVLLADWIVEEEAHARTVDVSRSDDWLLGLTFYDQCHEIWKKMANQILLDPTKLFPVPAATAIRNIANRLLGEPHLRPG